LARGWQWVRRAGAAALIAVGLTSGAVAQQDGLTVLAASSLTDLLTAHAEQFTADTGVGVRLSFAASSRLARQIEQGAPADVYVSADQAWMDHLIATGHVDAVRVHPIAANRLVVVTRTDSDIAPFDIGRTSLVDILPPGARLAVGDPAHVPVGRYAAAALRHLGQWSEMEPRLAPADNTRAALALVARGAAPLGIVYASDVVIDPTVRVVSTFPDDSHPPIRYPAAALGDPPREAATLYVRSLTSEDVHPLLDTYGLMPPDCPC